MGRTKQTVGYVMWAMLLASGCGSSGDGEGQGSGGSAGSGEPIDVRAITASLRAVDSCEDLLGQIQRDAIAKLDLAIARYEANPQGQFGGFPSFAVGEGASFGNAGAEDAAIGAPVPTATPATPPRDPGGFDGDTGGGGISGFDPGDHASGPTGFSGTNNQVADVDEADFVKVAEDGNRLYVLHGSHLFGVNAWPAAEMSMYGEPAEIEGNTSEMFVHDGKAVVFSRVEDYDGTRFEQPADGDQQSFGYRYRAFTKVTVLDVSSEAPSVLRELYYEGNYTSSRRHDDIVRVVLQASNDHAGLFHPDIEPFDAWGRAYDDEVLAEQLQQWRVRTASAIENTELGDWLATTYERVDGEITKVDPNCASYYTPDAGASGAGLTRIVGVDMSAPDANIAGTTVMGGASIVYANHSTMVLAQPDYRSFQADFGLTDGEQTALHTFDIVGAESQYRASGWVPGHPLDQFAIDATDDAIFVSTTGWQRVDPDATPEDIDTFWNTEPVNQVVALRDEDGVLEVVSSTGPIGHDNETTRSTRFIGDRAYVVTFEQTDPLIVVDRSNPEALMPLGEVEIPGFSTYMHPLGDDHLLTIGQNDGRGVQLQIFDVSDDLNPVRTHLLDYGNSSGSEAQWDHKAFNFYAEHDLLAVPMQTWSPNYQTGLDVLRVTIDDGFERLGMADHSGLAPQYCEEWWEGDQVYEECWSDGNSEVRRGVFINDEDSTYVYSISWGGIMAHELSDLDTPLATIQLPAARYNDGYGYGGDDFAAPGGGLPPVIMGGGSAPGSAPTPEPAPLPAPLPAEPDDAPEPEPAG